MSRWTIFRITVYIATTRCAAVSLLLTWAVTGDTLRRRNPQALRVVDAELAHHPQHRVGLDPLGHGGDAHGAADAADGGDHGAVDGIVGDVAHELAVDLEEVHRQVLEVAERAHARAEIVQREAATQRAQGVYEADGVREVVDRRGLGDLEAQHLRRDVRGGDLVPHEAQEVLVAERGAGAIDGDDAPGVGWQRARADQAAHRAHHEPVDAPGHQVVALGSLDERARGHQGVVAIVHAQERLAILRHRELGAQRDRLLHLDEDPFLAQGVADAGAPLQVAGAPAELAVARLEDVDAVAAALLRRVAGDIGRAHELRDALALAVDRHETDADAGLEQAVAPAEAEARDDLAQLLGNLARLGQVAMRHQHAELVSAEPPKGVVGAELRFEQRAQLPQQLVAGGVAARIVHHLELVQVEEHERMAARVDLCILERLAELALEVAAVDEAGERVMARLPGELVVERPGPRYVRVDEIADAQHPADAEQQHAQKRHLAVAARHRRHAIERQLHLDGTHQPIHFEHLADRDRKSTRLNSSHVAFSR